MTIAYGKRTENMWFGLSTDSKPLTQPGYADVFYETDTGNTWIWTGTNWVEYILSPTLLMSPPVWNDN